ncbi:CaiB/BaiF CoA-transferase family protein [Maritimibacter sp. HL-12]|uniref:CaiB/BaiF CoA transferase family protein n=1 Tax=Maritimibacter sp. HL-12 TaxID=1162418 RepID=UPI000A0F0B1C|nr:CoA transferase [Maritimibacter sp. HL-12]SMH38989.1 benzylsuccinate CoA-transferase BbsF subunit [Maritimibacter sp. HL-12]
MMGALDGLKVADFSWVGAGPRATKDLADNGATVVKIESARRLDLGRRSPPFAGGDGRNPDASVFFAQTNTSKRSVTINLSDPRGVDVAKRLVAWADVVVENFGPGYMDRIGLGWDSLQDIRPGIILASVSVAGRTGPMAGFRGYGNSAAAWSGHCDMTGWPGSEPHMPPFAYGDVVAPMMLTVAILSALEHRDRTGAGVWVDVSQIEAMVQVAGDLFAEMPAEKPANDDPDMTPHGVFPCRDSQWIAIACENDAQRAALEEILGNAAVAEATAGRDASALETDLVAAGIPAAAVLDGKGVSEHPALNAAGHFVRVEHPVIGPAKMPAPPYTFSDTPGDVRPSPCLGADNAAVFEKIGLTEAEVAELVAEGALA